MRQPASTGIIVEIVSVTARLIRGSLNAYYYTTLQL
jgi:hypothetical protein